MLSAKDAEGAKAREEHVFTVDRSGSLRVPLRPLRPLRLMYFCFAY
jgi:hypothetical protein